MNASDPEDVPVYRDAEVRDRHYREAEAEGEPYLAVETVGDGPVTVTFDLLPADAQLCEAARETLRDRLVSELETLVADPDEPTGEVSHSLGPSLGSISGFEGEAAARSVAATVAPVVLDRSNWESHKDPGDGAIDPRSND